MLNTPLVPGSPALSEFCVKHNIRRLALFGSRLAGTPRQDSDVDLLVEFEAGHVPGFFRLSAMQDELQGLIGLPVDLRTYRELSRFFRDEVARQARVLYAG